MLEVFEKSCANPPAMEEAGNNVSPNAAIAPVTLTTMATAAPASTDRGALKILDVALFREAAHAVAVKAPSSSIVLVKWAERYNARAHDALCATNRNRTKPAPNNASISRNTIDSEA
jgi:hypothetical protein